LAIIVDKVLASENWLKGSHIPSMVDEERMRPGHWLRLVIYVSFDGLILTVGLHHGP